MDMYQVKIQTYKKSLEPAEFTKYSHCCNKPRILPNTQEQNKMIDRFEKLHWKTDNVLILKSHDDKMFTIRQEQSDILDQQRENREDVEIHRLNHLQRIRDNIQDSRDRFYRRTELERPGAIEKQQGEKPLYKIVNDGIPIKF